MMMKPSDKKAWVAALRSGEYEQGRRSLCKYDKYCCLGVAYDVLCVGDWQQAGDGWGVARGESLLPSLGLLPDSVANKLGLGHVQHQLADLNDSGRGFGHIAKWIEENDDL
jgi:hypothetical protein